jgi:glycosyltransferase involved in cell wall biosynthesis
MSLRVVHVTATYPPYFGGTGNVCYHNARELARAGHTVHVVTAAVQGASRDEVCDGVRVKRLRALARVGNAPLLPGLAHALRGFDLIHLHYPFFGGEITALAAALQRTPLVVTYHQDVLLHGPLAVVERALRYSVDRWTLRSAHRVLFTSLDYGRSSYVAPMLRDRQHSVGELPNGVDTTIFTALPSPADLRHGLELTDSARVVLLVARLDRAHYFKGVDVLLEALTQLPSDAICVIVGDGDLRARYVSTARRMGLASRVRFVGRVADEDLPLYYRLADVTVLPSTTMGEAFGLVLLESMASGTTVVASDLPGVRTVVVSGDDGLLVIPGDANDLARALGRLLHDDELRQRMALRGRQKVEQHYDWARIGLCLETIYLRLLNASASGRQPLLESR